MRQQVFRSDWGAANHAGEQDGHLRGEAFCAVVALEEVRITLCISVRDSAEAAQLCPMELRALRAGVMHRIFKLLSSKWICPLTAVVRVQRLRAQAKLPDFTSASFRDAEAAEEWSAQAEELKRALSTRARSSEACAHYISSLMAGMAKLLPFCRSKAVQRAVQLPFIDVDLSEKGHFVYTLLSPFLTKLYVGAVGLKGPRAPYARLREHVRLARLWDSKTSKQRYGKRALYLHKAMAKVGEANTIMVILARTTLTQLPSAERAYIKLLSPIFNVAGVSGDSGLPRAVERLLGSAGSEDVRMVASLLLRKNRPRLPVHAWPSLVALVLRTGDRELAAKLARQARQICPQLCRLRSAPRLVFPCPIPAEMMRQIRVEVKAALDKMPFLRRTPQFTIMVEGTAVCWEKTPFAEVMLAPGTIPWTRVAPCQCTRLTRLPRYCGHVVTRCWETLPCCARLAAVVKASSLQCRTYPAFQQIMQSFG